MLGKTGRALREVWASMSGCYRVAGASDWAAAVNAVNLLAGLWGFPRGFPFHVCNGRMLSRLLWMVDCGKYWFPSMPHIWVWGYGAYVEMMRLACEQTLCRS